MSEVHIPDPLPEKPTGWGKRLNMHLNFGEDGGAAIYTVMDNEKRETCISYQYDTRKPTPPVEAKGKRKAKPAFEPPKTGFHVPRADTDVYESWKALHEAWPAILAALRAGKKLDEMASAEGAVVE